MKKKYFSKIALTVLGLCAFGFSKAQTVTTFNYTGSMQTYVVPAGVTSIDVDMIGASGGWDDYGGLQVNHIPGDGGRVQTTLTVVPGTTLNLYVAGIGNNASAGTGGNGGFNGGGNGGTTGTYSGGGGGGASDIRVGGTAFTDRIVIAGGGGGAAYNFSGGGDNGGQGGDLIGTNGESNNNSTDVSVGIGGNQSAGGLGGQWAGYNAGTNGSLGLGGDGATGTSGGGAGGGYYGGGGGSWSGGGGGSSYTDAGLTSATTHTQGFNTGDGQIIITELCIGLTTTVSNSVVCDGDLVTLDASSTTGGTVTWDNGITSGVAFTPALGTTTYTATSTDVNECVFSVDITVNALPTVTGTVNNALICLGDSIILNGAGADTYVWDNGATDGVEFTPATSGALVYTVTGTDLNSCVNTGTVNVQVNELVFAAAITNEFAGNDGAIDLTVTGGTGTNNYAWSSGEITEDISGLTIGSYTVTVDDGVCLDSATFTIVNIVGIQDNETASLEVYPNPTSGIITISVDGTFNYTIMNILGEVVITGQGNDNTNVDLFELSRGAYFITIDSNNHNETLKIIKQ